MVTKGMFESNVLVYDNFCHKQLWSLVLSVIERLLMNTMINDKFMVVTFSSLSLQTVLH